MGVIETYSNYKPMKLEIGKAHPDPVVETASMASVEPPDVWYKLAIERESPETVDEGKLSALQLESITYASQQHEQMLRDGNRCCPLTQFISRNSTIFSLKSSGSVCKLEFRFFQDTF